MKDKLRAELLSQFPGAELRDTILDNVEVVIGNNVTIESRVSGEGVTSWHAKWVDPDEDDTWALIYSHDELEQVATVTQPIVTELGQLAEAFPLMKWRAEYWCIVGDFGTVKVNRSSKLSKVELFILGPSQNNRPAVGAKHGDDPVETVRAALVEARGQAAGWVATIDFILEVGQ